MARTLYEELLEGFTKEASTADYAREFDGLDNAMLSKLAGELAAATGDSQLAEMAKVLPVYASGAVDKDIETQKAIANAAPTVPNSVTGGVAEETTKLAAEDDKEDEKEDKKPAFLKKKEDDKKDDKEDDKEDDSEDDKEDEKSAAETLYEILKEGAALEELIEIRAAQMVEDMIKQAAEMDAAEAITDAAGASMASDPMQAYEYSKQMLEKAKTVAAQNDCGIAEAASAVVGEVSKLAGLMGDREVIASTDEEVEDETVYVSDEGIELTASEVTELLKEAVYAKSLLAGAKTVGKNILTDVGNVPRNIGNAAANNKYFKTLKDAEKATKKAYPGDIGTQTYELGRATQGARGVYDASVKPIKLKTDVGAVVAAKEKEVAWNKLNAIPSKNAESDEMSLEILAEYANELEEAYEKVAASIVEMAEQKLVAAGAGKGLVGAQLHDFVERAMENVKTLGAKKNINLAQAASEYLGGVTGSITGVEVTEPSQSVSPSPAVAAVINANVTQSPDQAITQMVASVEPNPEAGMNYGAEDAVPAPVVSAADEVKVAAAQMLAELFKQAGINFNGAVDTGDVYSEKLAGVKLKTLGGAALGAGTTTALADIVNATKSGAKTGYEAGKVKGAEVADKLKAYLSTVPVKAVGAGILGGSLAVAIPSAITNTAQEDKIRDLKKQLADLQVGR